MCGNIAVLRGIMEMAERTPPTFADNGFDLETVIAQMCGKARLNRTGMEM